MTRVVLSRQGNAQAAGCSPFDRDARKATRALALASLQLLAREGQTEEIRELAAIRLAKMESDLL